jgi:hypothetical protein
MRKDDNSSELVIVKRRPRIGLLERDYWGIKNLICVSRENVIYGRILQLKNYMLIKSAPSVVISFSFMAGESHSIMFTS